MTVALVTGSTARVAALTPAFEEEDLSTPGARAADGETAGFGYAIRSSRRGVTVAAWGCCDAPMAWQMPGPVAPPDVPGRVADEADVLRRKAS